MAQRRGTIAQSQEHSHQPARGRRARRLERSEFPPPTQGELAIAAIICGARQALERGDVHLVKTAAMPGHPRLKIVGVPEKKTIQEWTLTQRVGVLESPQCDGALEFADITGDG